MNKTVRTLLVFAVLSIVSIVAIAATPLHGLAKSAPLSTPSVPTSALPWLKTMNGQIVRVDNNQRVELRGVNVLRNEWVYPDMSYERLAIPQLSSVWHANLITHGFASAPVVANDATYLGVLDEYQRLAEQNNMYIIFCYYYPTINGDQPPNPDVDPNSQQALVDLVQRYRTKSNVMFMLQAEPHSDTWNGQYYRVTWNTLRPTYDNMITAMRAVDNPTPSKHLILASGDGYGRDISPVVVDEYGVGYLDPIRADGAENVVYSSHPYDTAAGSNNWDYFLPVADAGYPVLVTEFGTGGQMAQSDTDLLMSMMNNGTRHVGWTAWIFDSEGCPCLLTGTNTDFIPSSPYGVSVQNRILAEATIFGGGSLTNTPVSTPTNTSVSAPTNTPTRTPTGAAQTATTTRTPTGAATATPTATGQATATRTPTSLPTPTPGSGLPPIPPGIPTYFSYGLFNANTPDLPSGVPIDYRYQYLAGGANTGNGWATWNSPPGQYATNYINSTRAVNMIPTFIYYQILQSAPNYDEYTNLQNTSTMYSYFDDFKLLMQKCGQAGGTVLVDIEPDLTGVMQQHPSNTSDNAALQPSSVASSGHPDVQGIANNFRGVYQALAHLRDLYAPSVKLGIDVSAFGATDDVVLALRDNPNYDWQNHATRTANYLNSLGPGFDTLFYNPSDRDAAWYQITQGSNRWWDDLDVTQPTFNTMGAWYGRIMSLMQRRGFMWQVPNGNRVYRSENNTDGHWQDNKTEYFLNPTSGRAHAGAWANYGLLGMMFGAGAGSQSHYFDYKADGITNPPPINGNNQTALYADDDGGYLRLQLGAYYSGGTLPLPGSGGGGSTATPTRTPTRTATNTPASSTQTFTPTRTATNSPVPPTQTLTPTRTATNSPVPPTQTFTPTWTPTKAVTATNTNSPANTNTPINTPTNTPTTAPTNTFTPTPVGPSCEAVVWVNLVNVTATGNTIQKTGGAGSTWDAGAVSTRAIMSGDGYAQASVDLTSTYKLFGLSNGDANATQTDVDFALYMAGGALKVYESGVLKANVGTYVPGDTLKVSVESGVVKYYRNGGLLYTSAVAPTYPLLVDTSINSSLGRVTDVYICSTNLGPNATFTPVPAASSTPTSTFTATAVATATATPTPSFCQTVNWTNLANVTATGNTIQKTGGVGSTWDAGAVSDKAIISGDGYVQASVDVTSTYRMFGLSNGDTGVQFSDIDYAAYLAGSTLMVYERGVYRGSFGGLTPGDVVKVSVESGVVKYYRNGVLVYTSAAAPTYPLLLDTAINSSLGKVYNAYICGANLGAYQAH